MTTDTTRLDELVTGRFESARAPSLLAAVFGPNSVLWQASRGDAGTQYRIGSITKTFTAVAVMQLRDDGLLDLDDEIGKHVADAPYADHSIRRLLSHRSGMTAEPTGPWWERTRGMSWEELAAANTPGIDVLPSGARYHYSNLGFAILGELVARRRGMTWWQAVSESILTPLAMSETSYHPATGAAIGSSRDPLTGTLVREPTHDSGAMAPAGQMWSTPTDLARWGAFLASGHPDVLPIATLTEMRTCHSSDPEDQHTGGYGLGLRLRWAPSGTLVGHTGSMPGFLAGLFVDPRSGFGATVLANVTTKLPTESASVELVDAASAIFAEDGAALADAAEAADARTAWSDLAGPWYWGNTTLKLRAVAGGLVVDERDGPPVLFSPAGPDRFIGHGGYFAGEYLNVCRRSDGTVSHLEVVTFIMTRTPYDPQAPIPGGLPEPFSPPG